MNNLTEKEIDQLLIETLDLDDVEVIKLIFEKGFNAGKCYMLDNYVIASMD